MARLRSGWTCGVVVALTLGLSALAAEPDSQAGKKNEPSADQKREAREIYRALKDIHDALEQESRASQSPSPGNLPKHAARTVKSPTIDSAGIDQMLNKYLAEAKVPAARLTTDEEFVRRAFLDVVGKPPTPAEIVAFTRDRSKNKRAKLIEGLLNSDDYAANWARYWRDVIRFHATETNPARARYGEFEEWLADQLKANRPWDEIASDIITAKGRNDENGAVVFALAQMAQPVEMAGEVSRIFMGVQIQCAQCHDHPNDPWKREQFHEFAAFFAGMQARRAGGPKAQTKGQPQAFEVVERGRTRYTMPDLKDPQKQIPVAPRFFLASKSEKLSDDLSPTQRRAAVAGFITSQDNPWFAKAFVNRVWYALMGEGFYDPVDDMGPARTPNAPEVLDTLASQWQQGGYDIKWLFRTILNTRSYQRESRGTNTAAGRTPFASNCPSRLRADQIIDSLAHVLGSPLDAQPSRADRKNGETKVPKKAAGPLGRTPRGQLNVLFGVDPSTPIDDILGTIPQALFMMNGTQINRSIQAGPNSVLGEILTSAPDNREALELLYLRVLSRRPNGKEISICGNYMMKVGNRKEAFEDIYWSLINSTEFLSRR